MTLKHLIDNPLMLDDYIFVDIAENIGEKHNLRRILMSADFENYDLFVWDGNWLYERTVDRKTALSMIKDAWDVYQRVIT